MQELLYSRNSMSNLNSEPESDHDMDLSVSEGMNANQQAHFLQISASCQAESDFEKLLPHLYSVPSIDRTLIEKPAQSYEIFFAESQEDAKPLESLNILPPLQSKEGIRALRRVKKQKAKTKRDYDKNICGYITKKVLREFLGGSYSKEIARFTSRYACSYEECKSYYLKKVQYITGPSHLPDLFSLGTQEAPSLINCKRVFREFYRWFLEYRYLRYLLKEGKMVNKLAYIQYKNTHLFKYVEESENSGDEGQARLESLHSSSFKETENSI